MEAPHKPPSPVTTTFTRAVLDRNMTINTASFENALSHLDLSGLAILDFGSGTGNLLRLLRHTTAHTIYAFEVMPEHLAPEIQEWLNDPDAKPRLVLNPSACKIDHDAPDGDLTAYDYDRILKQHVGFAIISNPPYFLYNRVLSLSLTDKFAGALMITSRGRLHNHPDWDIVDIMNADDFDPPAYNAQYLLQTGFQGRSAISRETQPHIQGNPQPYPHINNRSPVADVTDHYPDMWAQLNKIKRGMAP